MPRFVALFRGINVGRAKRIAMADLRTLLEALGYSGVTTLLNSGNAVFNGPAKAPAAHARRIQDAVASRLGVEALVIVKTAADIAAVVAGNALADSVPDPSRLLVALTQADQTLAATLASLAQPDWGDDRVHLGQHAAYLWCANGLLESKAAVAWLKGLAEVGTTRNWATVLKLDAALQGGA